MSCDAASVPEAWVITLTALKFIVAAYETHALFTGKDLVEVAVDLEFKTLRRSE